jgi:hydroxypyruvate isomerase
MTSFNRRTLMAAGALIATGGGAAGAQERILPATLRTRFAANVELWWRKLPFLDRIRKAAEFGFPAVEMWPYQGKDIDAIARLTQELKLEIAQFTCWGFEPGLNNPKNEDKFIARVEEACGVAKKLNVKKMCVVAGNNQPGMTQEQMLAQVTQALKRAAPIAEKHQVMLVLEPMNGRVDHPGHCLYGSPDAVRICREVNSPMVKILWDLYHMHITEGDLCGRLRDGFDQLGYVQIADHPGRHEPGTGEIHYNRVFKELHTLGYRGFVGMEGTPSTTEEAAARALAAADVW